MAEAIGGGSDATALVKNAGARARIEPQRAGGLVPRRWSAAEWTVLRRWGERALPALAVGGGASALVRADGASTLSRLGVGAAAGLALTLVLALADGGAARRGGERAARAAFLALVVCAIVARLSERLGVSASTSAARLVLLALAAAAATAFAGALAPLWTSAHVRRVLLVGNATEADATHAVGGGPIALLGPIDETDRAALAALGTTGVDDVIVARPLAAEEASAISCALGDAAVRVHGLVVAPEAAAPAGVVAFPSHWAWRRRGGLGPEAAIVKRALDAAAASALIAALSPLLALVAVLIKISSRGPVFFAQPRVGPRGVFRVLKFRTMRVGAHLVHEKLMDSHGTQFKLRRDPRVTRVGALLRRFSLDELPQLFQVLAGEMSLVGPRPPMPEEVARYTEAERHRLGARPGLTGLWQVSGRADLSFAECVALDARYIEQWSPWLEAAILARTAGAVIGGRGAYL